MSTLLESIVAAFMAADEPRRVDALRILRGDAVAATATGVTRDIESFLTLRGIGKALGVSPCSLWRWGVPGHELAGRRRFKLSEVQAYLETDEFRQRATELQGRRKAMRVGTTSRENK